MTTLHLKKSKAQSPLRLSLLLAALALAFFTIPDRAYAVDGPPTVQTLGVLFKASFSARLTSSVDPNGLASVHFQYGTTTDYGLTTAPETVSGHSLRHLDADISGLAADTTYHFRVVASNADGTSVGEDGIFQTLTESGRAVVMTRPATRITSSSAALNGVLDPHGSHTSVSFEYGPTTNYGFTTPAPTEIGNTFRNIDANVSGLAADTTYHFRIVTNNAHGTAFSMDRAFTTLIPTGPPVIANSNFRATRIASFSARLNSTVDPHGLATSVHFEYGTTLDYGLTTAPQTETGKAYRDIAAHISGLAAHTTYYFRPVASNAAGTTVGGPLRHFTTLTPTGPPVVMIEPATNVTASSATLHGVVNPHGLTTNVLFHLNNSHRATVIQTLTGNEYRDIAADFGHLGEHGGMFRLVAVNSAGRTESEFILVAP